MRFWRTYLQTDNGKKRAWTVTATAVLLMILQTVFIWFWLDSEEKSQREQSLEIGLETFQREQSVIYERMLESAFLISENSTFKASMSVGDEATVAFSADFFTSILHADLFQIFDTDMNTLSTLSDRLNINNYPNLQQMVKDALLGKDPPLNMENIQLHKVNNQIYNILVVPVLSPNRVYGAILIGVELSKADLEEFGDLYELLLFIADDQVIHLGNNANIPESISLGLIEKYNKTGVSLFETKINGTLNTVRILSIDYLNQTLYLIASKFRKSTFYQFFQWYLLFSSFGIILLISLNRISVPNKMNPFNSGK